jgi:hypothetical protein
MVHEFEMTQKHKISNTEIGDLMTTALEGGINYWCGEAGIKYDDGDNMVGIAPEDRWLVDFASDAIGPGGTLILTDLEGDAGLHGPWELTREKFIEGVKKAMEHFGLYSIEELMDNHDADTADLIIQFALFNEIVYA